VLVRPAGDLFPSLNVGSRYSDFLTRHPDWVINAKALREPRIRLHEELIAHAIHRVYIRRSRHRPSVPRVDRGETLQDRGQRSADSGFETPHFLEQPLPPSRLPVEVDGKD
jgi:hypothetical protein